MLSYRVAHRYLLWTTLFCVFCAHALSEAQTATSAPQTASGYRIAGTVVSKTDGHPLARTRVVLRDAKDQDKFESWVTADDGKFTFNALPAGKYSLAGTKRGFITAAYDQHDQFSTAIVTGAGLDTETLVLRLSPTAVITGKVLDEFGDPVRHASVNAYFDDHSSGVDQIRQARVAQTDDQGAYEVPSLNPGTYFLSANAKPWYAIHPASSPSNTGQESDPSSATGVDHSLDVAYPLTYYPDVTDAESAMPIPIRGGERIQVDIHLNPVPSLHLLFRVPSDKNNGFAVPQLEQPSFDGSTPLPTDSAQFVSPGLVEITGVPAGRYNVRLNGSGPTTQMNGVDFSKDGEEIDTARGEALGSVKVTAQVRGEATLPSRLTVGLGSAHRGPVAWKEFDAKGEAQLEQVPPGRYTIFIWGPPKPYSITRMSAEGASGLGRTLTVPAGATASVSLTLAGGSLRIDGTAKRAGKPFAGAMVVLVPKDPEVNRDLFRRDQSDLDGTFTLQNVVPGSYTVLAIENGWDLNWSQPGVIAAYLSRGRTIEVGQQAGRAIKLPDPVEVVTK
jgi:hypothetical protein